MSILTISERLFEQLCSQRDVGCTRIPEGPQKTADYSVALGSLTLVTEVKQLEPNNQDKKLAKTWGTPSSPGAVAPSDRVQGLLDEGYPQVKRSCEAKWPSMIVVYNNSGRWNWIDTFTISKAMFGSVGFVLELQRDQAITVARHGYLGERRITKDTFRSLSVVGVLKQVNDTDLGLDCYHNPFAAVTVDPRLLTCLADEQYIHPNPHERGFVHWEPGKLKT